MVPRADRLCAVVERKVGAVPENDKQTSGLVKTAIGMTFMCMRVTRKPKTKQQPIVANSD